MQPRLVEIFGSDKRIHHQNIHPESAGNARHAAANIAVANQPQRFIA